MGKEHTFERLMGVHNKNQSYNIMQKSPNKKAIEIFKKKPFETERSDVNEKHTKRSE